MYTPLTHTPPAAVAPRGYTVNGFLALYPIGRTKLYGEIKAGRLHATKFFGRTLIDAGEADRWWSSVVANRPS